MQTDQKIPILIDLTTRQRRKGEPCQELRLQVPGVLYRKDHAVFITYDETNDSGLGDSRTTLKVESTHKKVTVLRSGTIQMKYVWQRGQTSRSDYTTPFGTFEMEVYTNTLQIQLEEQYQSGWIRAQYRLLFGGEPSDMEFRLEFQERLSC